MSAAADFAAASFMAAGFIDSALQWESTWERAQEFEARFAGSLRPGDELRYYGCSIGAVRATIRNAGLRYPGWSHDDVTALSSELWSQPVFERRLAAIVLLQTYVTQLTNTDLTRLEGFVRNAGIPELVDALATDVIAPLIAQLDPRARAKADVSLDRWLDSDDGLLMRAAGLARQ